MGTATKEQQTEWERFRRDTAYLDAHYEELLNRYPEQWIAIFNQEVVGAGADFERLLAEIEERGIPVGRALVEYLTRDEELLILPS